MVIEKNIVIKNEDGVEQKYIYKVIKENLGGDIQYGVQAIRNDINNGIIIKTVQENVSNISSKEEDMEKIIDMLCKNIVSPIHLKDIIVEYVDIELHKF